MFPHLVANFHSCVMQLLWLAIVSLLAALWKTVGELPVVFSYANYAGQTSHELIKYVGYDEAASFVYLSVVFWFAFYYFKLGLYYATYLVTRRSAVAVGSVFSKTYNLVGADEKGIIRESAFGADKLVMLMKKPPRGVVKLLITLESDGLFSSVPPTFVGFATRWNGYFVTAAHCINPVLSKGVGKIFVAGLESDRCYEVTYDELVSESSREKNIDVAYLNPGRLAFTALGVKVPKWGLFSPGFGTQVMSYSVAKGLFTETYADAKWERDPDNPLFFYTKSNTTGGDSGLPIIQAGFYVGIHTGAAVKRRLNVHTATPFLAPQLYEKVLKRHRLSVKGIEVNEEDGDDITVNAEGIKTESPINTAQKREQEEFAYYVQIDEDNRRQRREEKEERAMGEHEDEQGFRKKVSAAYKPYEPASGKAWADMDYETSLGKAKALGSAVQTPQPSPQQKAPTATECSTGSSDSTTTAKPVQVKNTQSDSSTDAPTESSKPAAQPPSKRLSSRQKAASKLSALQKRLDDLEKVLQSSKNSNQESPKSSSNSTTPQQEGK